MVNFLLQENIDDLQKLSDRLLHISDENGYIYADDLSELHQAIHEKIIDLYSQRGKTPEQDATLCLACVDVRQSGRRRKKTGCFDPFSVSSRCSSPFSS